MPIRRLEAESLRDTLFAVANCLNDTPFGKPDGVDLNVQSGFVFATGQTASMRRTIYLLQRRTQVVTLLEDFDLPAMSPNCVDRPTSTVAPQALHLMNNRSIHELAERFSVRLREGAESDEDSRIVLAFKTAFGRRPERDEMDEAIKSSSAIVDEWKQRLMSMDNIDRSKSDSIAREKALVNLCHALINSAEFLTID
ncbi:MAG: DUF1553 domain-containing protein, partial [Planctomycetes bacterium]|nr:DUF1553 domain-containing protein [Planctomycetota bacterium]